MNIKVLEQRVRSAFDAMEAAAQAIADAADDADLDELRSGFDTAQATHKQAVADLARAKEIEEARKGLPVTPQPDSPSASVKREPLTYDRHNMRDSWLLDLARVQFGRGDVDGAKARLARHEQEIGGEIEKREKAAEAASARALDEMLAGLPDPIARALAGNMVQKRDMSRVDGSGGHFVPPLHLLEEYAAFPRTKRPFVESVRGIPLPTGTDSISIPRITTGARTDVQTGDNNPVTEQDLADNVVNAPVRTIAGQVDLALQLLDQSPLAFDQIVFEDLVADYYERCEDQVINGSGAAGQVLGIRNVAGITTVTYTDASPTVPELYKKVAEALSQSETARKAPVTAGWIAPRRFWWAASALDASNRPFVVPTIQGPTNAAGIVSLGGDSVEDQALNMLAMFKKTHAIPTNLGAGTNEDVAILTRPQDHLFFEGTIRARAMQEVGSGTLTARLQVYSYVAFTAGRFPASTTVISGTGLSTPSFA